MPFTKLYFTKVLLFTFISWKARDQLEFKDKHLGSVTLSMEDNNGPFVTISWSNSANYASQVLLYTIQIYKRQRKIKKRLCCLGLKIEKKRKKKTAQNHIKAWRNACVSKKRGITDDVQYTEP